MNLKSFIDFFINLLYNIYVIKIKKGKVSMTRTLAIEASNRLSNIEDFEAFMDEIDGAVKEFDGFIDPTFLENLTDLMEHELARLNAQLAELKGV